MILRHLHLPNLTHYHHADRLQQALVRRLLAFKANPSRAPPPEPTIITAEFHPVYTCGRREVGNLTSTQINHLTEDVSGLGKADFHEALRGGQTTFHGPGQLVAYPILDLKRHKLSARCYVSLLESAVIKTCSYYGVETRRTEHPGVWVDEQRKICALGVHLRRNVSSHGIGLNVNTDLRWFERIVGCGLEGKGTTSLEMEGVKGVDVHGAGEVFVAQMAETLEDIEQVVQTNEMDIEENS